MKCNFQMVLFAFFLILVSCEKDTINVVNSNADNIEQEHIAIDGSIVLGKKLNDPYAIDNMKEAFANLKSAEVNSPIDEIQPNKKYLRFLPKDEAELDLLSSDTSFILFDFPLDFEIEVHGTYYHDPELPDSLITWQYCVVPIDFNEPNIKHELLYEVYIPPYDSIDDNNLKNSKDELSFYERLTYEAFLQTDNLDEDEASALKSTDRWRPFKPKRWTPKGRITMRDDLLGTIPLVGVNVHARWSTHIEDDITDANGRFSMGGFIYKVNYSIKWDRYQYSIRSDRSGQAWYNGPKQKGDWNLHISGGASGFYATLHRAAYHYYYGNTGGLRRPPSNSASKPQMKIAAMYKSNSDVNGRHAASLRIVGLFNWIKIWNPQHDDDDIYATTIHELAHASHWSMDHGKFNSSSTKVKESWARGVQWHLTRMIYSGYTPSYFGNYTGIVQDMVDGRSGYDQVSGYSMSQLENAIKGRTSWDSWRRNIINKYNNGTEGNLQALFNHW